MSSLTRRDFFKLAVAAGVSLTILPPGKRAQADTGTPPSRVLWLSWDGADWRTVSAMAQAGELPNLATLNIVRLDCGGCSVTKPGHVEAITGLDYWKTKVYTNTLFREVPAKWSAFWKIKNAYPTYWCGCIFSKGEHTGDAQGRPWRPLKDWALAGGMEYYYNFSVEDLADVTIEQTNARLAEALSLFTAPGLLYCHWAEPDCTGHLEGMDSEPYRACLRQLDDALGTAVAAITPDVVVVYSDHGFNGPGETGHAFAPNGFLAASTPLLANGVRRDVAYTMMNILGLPVASFSPRLCGKDLRT
jgi:hypothetical protein